MPFEVGSIIGHLGLEISEYTHGMLEAESIAELMPEWVTAFMASPLLGLMDVFKEVGEAGADMLKEVAGGAEDVALAAQKAGTSVEFMSEWTHIGETVKVSQEDLSAGFRGLQRNAADAVNGMNKEAAKAFGNIGISTEWLQSHLGDTEGLFLKVRDALRDVGDAATRSADAQLIMSRGGESLIPIFELQDSKVQSLIETFKNLNAIDDDAAAKSAQSWTDLSAIIEAAWEDVKKTLAEPVLEWVEQNSASLEKEVQSLAAAMTADLKPAVQWMTEDGGIHLANAFHEIEAAMKVMVATGEELARVLADIAAHAMVIEGIGDSLAILGGLTGNLPLLATGAGLAFVGHEIGKVQDTAATYPQITVNNEMLFDPDRAATETVKQITPALKKARQQTREALRRAANSRTVGYSMGVRY